MTLRDFTAVAGSDTLQADFVVIGSGPGGAAVSRALAEAGASVVVLEEGPAKPRFRPNLAHTYRYHMQEQGTMIAEGSTFMPIAAGRGVGGGSLVNSAICFRTPDHVLGGWEGVLGGDDRYSPANMAPVFGEVEGIIGVTRTAERIAGENNMIIVRGAQKLGLPGGLVNRNAPDCQGCGLCNMGCPVGGKHSVDRNLVPLARAAGAVVQADIKVDEILVEGGRAVGAAGDVRDTDTQEVVGRLVVRADRGVIVCCGGIGTPRLLHHTGMAKILGPAVGEGLHVHPGNAVLGYCDHVVKMWSGATQGAFFEDPAMHGFLPHTFSAPPGALLLITGKAGMDAKEVMPRLKHVCGCIVMISDKGSGRVGATRDGRAKIEYWFDPHDVQRIKDGMVRTAEVLLAGGAKTLFTPVHGVGEHTTAESLKAAIMDKPITDFAMYASHPMGTCRMGLDPETSVIGPTAEAHRLKGLYIADSSIFPTSLGVNPQLTTMTMATVIGRNIAAG